ncbi:unnamed protein product [Protopolystoma xenopodis]|uniref:Uncharacterized protein n=1 Tax=Protopolystoma xenopodis TaxID=117903 RepID=A0A3S5AMT0_9PLAT|nr:unnamed protein product [Protopolystoma xenopodis]
MTLLIRGCDKDFLLSFCLEDCVILNAHLRPDDNRQQTTGDVALSSGRMTHFPSQSIRRPDPRHTDNQYFSGLTSACYDWLGKGTAALSVPVTAWPNPANRPSARYLRRWINRSPHSPLCPGAEPNSLATNGCPRCFGKPDPRPSTSRAAEQPESTGIASSFDPWSTAASAVCLGPDSQSVLLPNLDGDRVLQIGLASGKIIRFFSSTLVFTSMCAYVCV